MRRRVIGLGLLLLLAALVAWWLLRPSEGCPEGMVATGPITDTSTGKVIGMICQGPKSGG
jgi:hypothetical protein